MSSQTDFGWASRMLPFSMHVSERNQSDQLGGCLIRLSPIAIQRPRAIRSVDVITGGCASSVKISATISRNNLSQLRKSSVSTPVRRSCTGTRLPLYSPVRCSTEAQNASIFTRCGDQLPSIQLRRLGPGGFLILLGHRSRRPAFKSSPEELMDEPARDV